jgi:hypothetical protein
MNMPGFDSQVLPIPNSDLPNIRRRESRIGLYSDHAATSFFIYLVNRGNRTFNRGNVATSNPFAELSAILPPLFMQRYFVLMIVAVAPGTLVGRLHQVSTII